MNRFHFLMLMAVLFLGLSAQVSCGGDDDDDDSSSDDDATDDDATDDDATDDDATDDDATDDDTTDDDDDDVSILFEDLFDDGDYVDDWSVGFSDGTYTALEASDWLTLTGEFDDGGNVWLVTNETFDDTTVAFDCAFKMEGWGRSGIGFWVDASNWLTLTIGTDDNEGYWMGGAWNSAEAWGAGPFALTETFPSTDTHVATVIKNDSTYNFYLDGTLLDSFTGDPDWMFDTYNLTIYTRSDSGAGGDAQIAFDYCTLYADAEL